MVSRIKQNFTKYDLWFILFVALVLRIGYVSTLENKAYWLDESVYHGLATRLAAGDGFVDDSYNATAYRPVGYPLFIAAIYKVTGPKIQAVRFVQIIISLMTVAGIYFLTRWGWGAMPARLAALFSAIYPFNIYVTGILLPATLFSFLLLAVVVLLFKANFSFPGR